MPRTGGVDKGIYESPKGSGKWYVCFMGPSGRLIRKLIGSKSSAQTAYLIAKEEVRMTRLGLNRENIHDARLGKLDPDLAGLVDPIKEIARKGRVATLPVYADCIHRSLKSASVVYYFTLAQEGPSPIKIGVSRSVVSRWRQFQESMPFKVIPLAAEIGNNQTESRRMEEFSRFCIRGEWFRPAPEILSLIESIRADNPEVSILIDHLAKTGA